MKSIFGKQEENNRIKRNNLFTQNPITIEQKFQEIFQLSQPLQLHSIQGPLECTANCLVLHLRHPQTKFAVNFLLDQ